MKAIVSRTPLLKTLSHVTGVVERRTTLPISACVLIEATEDAIRICGTDFDIEVAETLDADVSAMGSAAVSAHLLQKIVKSLPVGADIELALTKGGNHLNLKCGSYQAKLDVLPGSDFPEMGIAVLSTKFSIAAEQLATLLRKTMFAVSTDENQYYLSGVYLHVANGKLCFVGTNGHRLALLGSELPEGAADMPGVILPRKTTAEMLKLLSGQDGDVVVEASPMRFRLTVATTDEHRVVLTSKLVDGAYPHYPRVIPPDNDITMVVATDDFTDALNHVGLLVAEEGRAMKLSASDGKLILSVSSPTAGSAQEEIAAEYSGQPMAVGFNARYLLEMAGAVSGKQIQFKLGKPGTPALITDVGNANATFVIAQTRV